MGNFVDLYDVKVVDGYLFRCAVVHYLDERLFHVYNLYADYEDRFFYVDSGDLSCLVDDCLDLICIMSFLRDLSLLSKSLEFDFNFLRSAVFLIKDELERRKD